MWAVWAVGRFSTGFSCRSWLVFCTVLPVPVVALTDNYEEPIMYIGSSFLRVVAMQDILFHESSLYLLVPVPVVEVVLST